MRQQASKAMVWWWCVNWRNNGERAPTRPLSTSEKLMINNDYRWQIKCSFRSYATTPVPPPTEVNIDNDLKILIHQEPHIPQSETYFALLTTPFISCLWYNIKQMVDSKRLPVVLWGCCSSDVRVIRLEIGHVNLMSLSVNECPVTLTTTGMVTIFDGLGVRDCRTILL